MRSSQPRDSNGLPCRAKQRPEPQAVRIAIAPMPAQPPSPVLRRRDALLAAAAAVLSLGRVHAQPDGLPRFSSAPPGDGPPPGWRHETLPKVERANAYAIETVDGAAVLRITSNAAASSLVAPATGLLAAHGLLRWRWKVSRALAGSDLRTKAGDDYAARLYVLFDLPPERLALGDRLRLQAARALSGREIPAAALCYVWGTAQPAGSTGWNPYTDRVRMVVLDSGDAQAGQWRAHARRLRDDWAEAFPGPMPPVQAIAVGADTDNTGDSAVAWFGDVALVPAP